MERPIDRKPGVSLDMVREESRQHPGATILVGGPIVLALLDLAAWAERQTRYHCGHLPRVPDGCAFCWAKCWLDQWPAPPPAQGAPAEPQRPTDAQAPASGPAACETCQGRGTVPNPPAHRTEPPYRVPCPDCRSLVEDRAVPWPGVTGNVEFALRPGASRADMLEVADVVRARVLQSLEAQLKPDARVTARRAPTEEDLVRLAMGGKPLPAAPPRVHKLGTDGMVQPEKLRQAMARYTTGADTGAGDDRTVETVVEGRRQRARPTQEEELVAFERYARSRPEPERTELLATAEARRRELQDQEAQKFLAQAEQVTGYASPYLRKPQPVADGPAVALERLRLEERTRRLLDPAYVPPDKVGVPRPPRDRSAWGRRLELAAALLVGALLAWAASHVGR